LHNIIKIGLYRVCGTIAIFSKKRNFNRTYVSNFINVFLTGALVATTATFVILISATTAEAAVTVCNAQGRCYTGDCPSPLERGWACGIKAPEDKDRASAVKKIITKPKVGKDVMINQTKPIKN